MKIYLAGPFFNDEELKNIERAENILMSRGFSVFSPRLNEIKTEENSLGEASNLMVHEGCHSNISFDELEEYDFEMMPAKPYKGKMF